MREQTVPSFYYMSQSNALSHLEGIIRNAFDEGLCGDYYLVEIETSPNKRIAVYIDGDEGVSLDNCTRISRTLESLLDADPSLGDEYVLEVSSPGVSRPLKFLRQYAKHTGRTLQVTLTDGSKIEGKLTHTGATTITLDVKSQAKQKTENLKEIPFNEIKEAYVTVSFGKK